MLKIGFVCHRHAAHRVGLQVFPHEFVGIAIRRIGRQIKKPQFSAKRRNKGLRLLSAMRWASIGNQENGALRADKKPLQKLDEDIGVHAAFFLDHETHVPFRRDCRDEA